MSKTGFIMAGIFIAAMLAIGSQSIAASAVTLQSFPVGEVSGLAIDHAGKIWFTQRAAKKLVRLDPETGLTRTFTAPQTGNPEAVLVTPDNSIWITSIPMVVGSGTAKVARFNQQTETFEEFIINPGWTNNYAGTISLGNYGLALGPDGRIWFNDRSHPNNWGIGSIAHIGYIDPVTKIVTVLNAVPEAASSDVGVSSTGRVLYPTADGLYHYDEASQTSVATGVTDGWRLFSDKTGATWFPKYNYGIGRLDADGTISSIPLTTPPYNSGAGNNVSHIAFDSKNIAWFCQGGGKYFGRLDPQSGATEWIYATSSPAEIVVDDEDNIWIGGPDYDVYPGSRITKIAIDYDNDGYPNQVDCNDSDPAINPLAYEVPYNGIDENCNGLADDTDVDGDGFGVDTDCDDADPLAYPGASETKFDGIDQDCNGYDLTIDVSATYKSKRNELSVTATSDLGAAAGLELVGFGPMTFESNKWSITVLPPEGNPGTVTVSGIEGIESGDIK